jgi:hypothetical protein
MSPTEAVIELTRLGFRFRLEGDAIKVRFAGDQAPDAASVATLLGLVKANKEEVRCFLQNLPCPKNYSKAASQASSSAPPVTCEAACPWYELNPWTHYPEYQAWCHYRMEHLVAGSPACEKFNRGEIPPRLPYGPVVAATTYQAPPESTITCADCRLFESNSGLNPRQGWGRCLKRRRGRYGCATACEAAITTGAVRHEAIYLGDQL